MIFNIHWMILNGQWSFLASKCEDVQEVCDPLAEQIEGKLKIEFDTILMENVEKNER